MFKILFIEWFVLSIVKKHLDKFDNGEENIRSATYISPIITNFNLDEHVMLKHKITNENKTKDNVPYVTYKYILRMPSEIL
jgi:hypothetical protein